MIRRFIREFGWWRLLALALAAHAIAYILKDY